MDLLVECPIHLDAVSIHDILVFKCGHGFCQPCLEEHLAHGQSNQLSCPTCRKPVRRKEAFPLFLSPAQLSSRSQSSPSTAEAAHARLTKELKETKAAHANCAGRFLELQLEIDTLRQDGVHHNQTVQHLRDRYEVLQQRLMVETSSSARAREENDRMQEEVAKLQVENQKTSITLEQVVKELQVQLERVKLFQGYVEQYKHKFNLEKKKRKAVENTNYHPLRGKEDDSLMVVDANAPDMLRQDGPDFRWLDEACKVKGDQLTGLGDEDSEFEKENEEDVQPGDYDARGDQREALVPPLRFLSDWNFGLEASCGPSSGITGKRTHGSKRAGGSKIVRVKMPVAGGPLAVDRQGHIKGTVTLGSRQKLNSKN